MGLLVNNVQLVLNVVGCKRRGRLTVGITMSTVVDVQMQVKRNHLRANVDAALSANHASAPLVAISTFETDVETGGL